MVVYHATTLENAAQIIRSQRLALTQLRLNRDKTVWGFFATPTLEDAEIWGYQIIYERGEEPPPVVLQFHIPDEMIEDIIEDPVALVKEAESLFVIIRGDFIDFTTDTLPLSNVVINWVFPVNEEEMLASISMSLKETARGGWAGDEWLIDPADNPELYLILEDDEYREAKAHLIALRRKDAWMELINAWNEYVKAKEREEPPSEEEEEDTIDYVSANTGFWESIAEQQNTLEQLVETKEAEVVETTQEDNTVEEDISDEEVRKNLWKLKLYRSFLDGNV